MRRWASELFDLPLDVSSGVARIELIGSERMKVENHHGINFFSQNKIRIQTNSGLIEIDGKDLIIKMLNPEVVWIEGVIKDISHQK